MDPCFAYMNIHATLCLATKSSLNLIQMGKDCNFAPQTEKESVPQNKI